MRCCPVTCFGQWYINGSNMFSSGLSKQELCTAAMSLPSIWPEMFSKPKVLSAQFPGLGWHGEESSADLQWTWSMSGYKTFVVWRPLRFGGSCCCKSLAYPSRYNKPSLSLTSVGQHWRAIGTYLSFFRAHYGIPLPVLIAIGMSTQWPNLYMCREQQARRLCERGGGRGRGRGHVNLKERLPLWSLIALTFLVLILLEDVARHTCIIVNPLLPFFLLKMVSNGFLRVKTKILG